MKCQNRIFLKFRYVLVAVLLALTLIPAGAVQAKAAAPKLSAKSLTLSIGQKKTLIVKNAKKKVKWTTSKSSVATVSSKGKTKGTIKAVGAGTAKITASVSGKKLRCTVKVSKPKTKVTSISSKTSDGKPFISDVNRMKTTFKLSSTSKNVVAQIVDESGNICYTKEFKRCAKNASVSFSWNGKDTSGQNLPSARYRARITVGKTVRNGKYFTLYSGSANAEIETITNDNEDFLPGVNNLNVAFSLDNPAVNVKAEILDGQGNAVFTKTYKYCKADAEETFTWNGKNARGQLVRGQTCRVRVTAGTAVTDKEFFTLSGNANANINISSAENGFLPGSENGTVQFVFSLDAAATDVKAEIIDSTDKVFFQQTFPLCQKQEDTSFTWDGKDTEGKTAPAGAYRVRVTAGTQQTTSNGFEVLSSDANATVTTQTSDGGDFMPGLNTITVSFQLDHVSLNVKAEIVDTTNKVLFSQTFSDVKAETDQSFTWDGIGHAGKTCLVRITAGEIVTKTTYFEALAENTSGFAGGNGSSAHPYQVATFDQLKNVGTKPSSYFIQTAAISGNLDTVNSLFGEDNQFNGVYNGNDHTISQLRINEGLFSYIGEKGVVQNITFSECSVTSPNGQPIGVLAVYNNGTIQSCTFDTCVLNTQGRYPHVGAVCGYVNKTGTITDCVVKNSTIQATGDDNRGSGYAGSHVGENFGKLIRCSAQNNSITTANGWHNREYAGGIAGCNESPGLLNLCSVASCTIRATGRLQVAGGVAGYNDGQIIKCSRDAATIVEGSQTGSIMGIGNGTVTD